MSSDPNYDGMAVAPLAVQVRDNDIAVSKAEPLFGRVGRRTVLSGFILTTSGIVDQSAAESEGNYRLVPTAGRRVKRIAIQSATYDAATEALRITTASPLGTGKFYELTVSNVASPGSSFVMQIGVGTALWYLDATGDAVELRMRRGGSIIVTRDAAGEGNYLGIFPTAPSSTLSGTVRKPRRSPSDGTTSFQSMSVQAGQKFTSTLTNPPFRVGPMAQARVDELLVASGGTLAGVVFS